MGINDEIFNEISEAREDERNAQNLIIQIISTAATVLGVIFAGSLFTNNNPEQVILFWLNSLIFLAAICFITTLGITNVLRYYYIQSLEERLAITNQESYENQIVHWMSFSSPITTRNYKHLDSKYAKVHYGNYSIATMSAIVFCASLLIIQFFRMKEYNFFVILASILAIICIFFAGYAYFYASNNAKDMYNYAAKKSMTRKVNKMLNIKLETDDKFENVYQKKKGKIKIKEIITAIMYFIYPKKKDFQKVLVISIGYYSGIFLLNNYMDIELFCNSFFNMLICCFLADFLVYQARYQINDIRGLKEDVTLNKKGRLPVGICGKKKAVAISFGIIFVRMVLFLFLLTKITKMADALKIYFLLVVIITIAYETVRNLKNNFGVFFIVSLGYPLRFFVGLLSAYPNVLNDKKNLIIVLLVLIAYAFFGEFSAIIPWIHETIDLKNRNKSIEKKHYTYLFEQIKKHYKQNESVHSNPLNEKGKILDLWNTSFIISIYILSLCILVVDFSITNLFIALLVMCLCSAICIAAKRKILLCLICLQILFAINIITCYSNLVVIYLVINQIFFSIMYYFLRCMYDVNFDFFDFCKNILIIIFIGKETWEYINDK